MGEVVDLLEYKRLKKTEEEEEIEKLKAELRSLIGEIGGIHVVPLAMSRDMTDLTHLDFGYSFDPGVYMSSSCPFYTVSTSGDKREDE
jgi:hypothetical protein